MKIRIKTALAQGVTRLACGSCKCGSVALSGRVDKPVVDSDLLLRRFGSRALTPLFLIAVFACMFFIVLFFVWLGWSLFGSGWYGVLILAIVVVYPAYRELRDREKRRFPR